MQFRLNEEQAALQENARRWVQKSYGFAQRRAVQEKEDSFSRAHWATMAELGWLMAPFPEEAGGLGGTLIDSAIVAEELGRALTLEPFVALGVLAPSAVYSVGDAAQAAEILPGVLAGERVLALAHGEHGAGGDLAYVETRAQRTGGGWRLDGLKSLVLGGPSADGFLVSARTEGGAADDDGISLFLLQSDRPGLAIRPFRTTDGRRACELKLEGVEVTQGDLVGEAGRALPGLRDAYARALAVLCAEAVGVMDQALWTTRDYILTRQQFGVPIATFQVLQHRASDMYVAVEQARGATYRALAHLGHPPALRDRAIASAKAQVGKCGHFVCAQAIQLHGGIGVTEEYVIGHHFKRMMLFQQLWMDTQSCLRQLAADLVAA